MLTLSGVLMNCVPHRSTAKQEDFQFICLYNKNGTGFFWEKKSHGESTYTVSQTMEGCLVGYTTVFYDQPRELALEETACCIVFLIG